MVSIDGGAITDDWPRGIRTLFFPSAHRGCKCGYACREQVCIVLQYHPSFFAQVLVNVGFATSALYLYGILQRFVAVWFVRVSTSDHSAIPIRRLIILSSLSRFLIRSDSTSNAKKYVCPL